MPGPSVFITHISTACVLLEIGSLRILTDPVFDEGTRQYSFTLGIWATRFLGPAVKSHDLSPFDVVLLSHVHHRDNLDESGERLLPNARQVITNRPGSEKLQVRRPV
jgi:L-ascorbate metabolism protein UlaG (beta-lactamase superfamily)